MVAAWLIDICEGELAGVWAARGIIAKILATVASIGIRLDQIGVKRELRPAAYIDEPLSIDPMVGVAVNRECRFGVKIASGRLACMLGSRGVKIITGPARVGINLKNLYQRKGKKMIPHSVMSVS